MTVMTLLFGVAIHTVSLSVATMCDRPGPQPVGFHSRGFSYVAEVFPANARRNTDGQPRVYMYEVGYPGPRWQVDARRLWSAILPVMPQAALVSMAGHLVMLDEHYQAGGEQALVVFGPDGRLVRTFALGDLLASADLEHVEYSDCGRLWRNGAAFYFARPPEAKLYVALPWGRVLEIDLSTGALKRGIARDFAGFGQITSTKFPNELTESWAINLRFSSLTDIVPPS